MIVIRVLHPDYPQNVIHRLLARDILWYSRCLGKTRSHFVTVRHLCTKPPKPIVFVLHSFIKWAVKFTADDQLWCHRFNLFHSFIKLGRYSKRTQQSWDYEVINLSTTQVGQNSTLPPIHATRIVIRILLRSASCIRIVIRIILKM